MDQVNEIKSLLAIVNAQQLMLSQLYAAHFVTSPKARKEMPQALVRAAMFMESMPREVMDEDKWVDIQARSVLYMRSFLVQLEGQLQAKDKAEVDLAQQGSS